MDAGIFSGVQIYTESIETIVSGALKKYWQDHDKWKKKKCSKKQWEKVQKVKDTLGSI